MYSSRRRYTKLLKSSASNVFVGTSLLRKAAQEVVLSGLDVFGFALG
jgi:hypothetical protein